MFGLESQIARAWASFSSEAMIYFGPEANGPFTSTPCLPN
jgi:hypothetical protein